MAVLDYVPEKISPTKISSKEPQLDLHLTPSPKVIGEFRDLFPGARLIGFKLETTDSVEALQLSARILGEKYDCDLVVANASPFLQPLDHSAYFLDRNPESWKGPIHGKPAIADHLVAWLEEKQSCHVSP
jgi:phosphopantothenoylcysteine synthetase/decarboxylase